MDLSINDSDELKGRARQITSRLDELFKDVGPKVAEIGRLRQEYGMIADELQKRGILDEEEKDGE